MAIKHKRLSGGRAHSLMDMSRSGEGIGMIILKEGDHDLGTARQVTYIEPIEGYIAEPNDYRNRSANGTIDLRDADGTLSGWRKFGRGERILITVPRSPDQPEGSSFRRSPNVAVCVCLSRDE